MHWALSVVLLAAGLALFSRSGRQAGPESEPEVDVVAILLPGAALLVTLDLVALQESPWGRSFLAGLPTLLGSTQDRECASRELKQARRLGLAVPTGSLQGADFDVGWVAEGPFSAADAAGCADAVVRSRGGQPAHGTLDGFTVLRDRRQAGELAVRDGGPLIVSGGSYFRDLVERASGAGRADVGLTERLHHALRANAGRAPLLASWVLAPGWLERWLSEPGTQASPLSAIRAVLIRGEADRSLRLTAELSVEDETSARRLEVFARRFAADIGAHTSDGFSITRGPSRVSIELSVQSSDVGALVAPLRSLSPSHPLRSPNAQKVEPEREGSAGRATEEQP